MVGKVELATRRTTYTYYIEFDPTTRDRFVCETDIFLKQIETWREQIKSEGFTGRMDYKEGIDRHGWIPPSL